MVHSQIHHIFYMYRFLYFVNLFHVHLLTGLSLNTLRK